VSETESERVEPITGTDTGEVSELECGTCGLVFSERVVTTPQDGRGWRSVCPRCRNIVQTASG